MKINVLKGLPEQAGVKEIHNKLIYRGYDVKKTQRMKSRITKRPLPMVLLKCGQEERDIWKVGHVLNLECLDGQEIEETRTMLQMGEIRAFTNKLPHRRKVREVWRQPQGKRLPEEKRNTNHLRKLRRATYGENTMRTGQSYTAVTQNN